jgi:hypothetical protein
MINSFPMLALLASCVVGGFSLWARSEQGLAFAGGLATGAFAAYQARVDDDTN